MSAMAMAMAMAVAVAVVVESWRGRQMARMQS